MLRCKKAPSGGLNLSCFWSLFPFQSLMSSICNLIEFESDSVFFIYVLLSLEAKEQVLANLANFAYDPKNTEYLRQLQVTDLFLDMLTEKNENFIEFGMGESF